MRIKMTMSHYQCEYYYESMITTTSTVTMIWYKITKFNMVIIKMKIKNHCFQ